MSILTVTWSMISGACHGVVALGMPDQGPYRPAACWPEGSDPSVALSKTAQAAIASSRWVAEQIAVELRDLSALVAPEVEEPGTADAALAAAGQSPRRSSSSAVIAHRINPA